MRVRPEIHDEYNRAVDAANAKMAWGAASVNTWYKNASGRVTQNWPFSLLEFWQRTRHPEPDDYILEKPRERVSARRRTPEGDCSE